MSNLVLYSLLLSANAETTKPTDLELNIKLNLEPVDKDLCFMYKIQYYSFLIIFSDLSVERVSIIVFYYGCCGFKISVLD
jgi:hypothetical protein